MMWEPRCGAHSAMPRDYTKFLSAQKILFRLFERGNLENQKPGRDAVRIRLIVRANGTV